MSKIAFPMLSDYEVAIKYLFSHITNSEIITPSNITVNTIELGNKYSPEFVCTPFKYTMGSLIESINNGADTLIQIGGGCRYGYYYKLQEQILRDLNYDVKLYNLVTAGKTNIKKLYKTILKIEPKLNIFKSIYYLLITVRMVKYMDKIDNYIRRNIGFGEYDEFINLKKKMLNSFSKTKNNMNLTFKYLKYKKAFKKLKIDKPKKHLKVGIIGELYTIMEPFSNYFLERELAKFNIEIKRFTNVDYLLFTKKKLLRKALNNTKEYMKYKLVADASSNIYWAKYLGINKYDGIIHIKSSFCTPEIEIMPILTKVANDYNIPIMFMSFDSNTSEVGVKTRIEAFVDMIEMRKNKCM